MHDQKKERQKEQERCKVWNLLPYEFDVKILFTADITRYKKSCLQGQRFKKAQRGNDLFIFVRLNTTYIFLGLEVAKQI